MEIPCRTKNVNKNYKVIAEVGSGTYGKVYKAKCLKTNEFVALKKIDTKDQKIVCEGFPITAIREIKLLKLMNHKNIIRLREIIVSKPSIRNNQRGSTFLVFDYMDHDFAGLHKIKNIFSLAQLKCIFKQILEGVKYLHDNKIIHRDLKSANLLLNNKGEVKIGDFGLARTITGNPSSKYTYRVVTLWYRAPELLLGQSNYTPQIDMWSVGCIFAELLTGEVLFKGDSEFKQIERIYEICGSINEQQWPDCVRFRQYEEFKPRRNYERQLAKNLIEQKIDESAIDLIDKLLILDPSKRLSAYQALQHSFFEQEPLPSQLKDMPCLEKEFHETLLKNEAKILMGIQSSKKQWQSMSYNQDKPFLMYGVQKFGQKPEQGSSQFLQKIMDSRALKDDREKKGPNDFKRKEITKFTTQTQFEKAPSPSQQQQLQSINSLQSQQPLAKIENQGNSLEDLLNQLTSQKETFVSTQDKKNFQSSALGIDEEPILRKKVRQEFQKNEQ